MTSPQPVSGPRPPALTKLSLFDSAHASHALSRKTVSCDGITYRLFLAVPKTVAPEGGFPILYLLDGNAVFDLLDAKQLASASGLILAGVGHDTDRRFHPPSRSRDYTPSLEAQVPFPDPARPERLIGGAEPFLHRLLGPIRQEVEAGLPVDPSRRMIFGHSLAGMFVLYTLLRQPDAFRRLAAASPSLWWGDEFLLGMEARTPAFANPLDVLITLGDSERRSSPEGPHWDGPAPHTLEMITRLQRRGNMTVSSSVLEGLGHAATLDASLPLVLKFATAS